MSHHIRISKRADLDVSWMMEDKSMILSKCHPKYCLSGGKTGEVHTNMTTTFTETSLNIIRSHALQDFTFGDLPCLLHTERKAILQMMKSTCGT